VVLPGVEKENISFKVVEDDFYVKATKKGLCTWTTMRYAAL